MSQIFTQSKWIWHEKRPPAKPEEFVIFYKKVTFEQKFRNLKLRVASSARYSLNIARHKKNKFVIRDGGMTGAVADYYDETDVSKYFGKGENALIFICEYIPFEEGGRLNETPSLIFELLSGDKVIASSDAECLCYYNDALTINKKDKLTFSNSLWKYDTTTERPLHGLFSTGYSSNIFEKAVEISSYDEEKIPLLPRPVPMFAFDEKPVKAKPVKTTTMDKNIYTVQFDSHRRVYPSFTFSSEFGGSEISVYGDDPEANQIYIVGKGKKSTLSFPYLAIEGDRLVIEAPKKVKIEGINYISTGFGEQMQASFDCSDKVLNSIFNKCASTLYACISDRFVSDAAKGSFDFYDASVAARDLMISYGAGGAALVRKMITDVLTVSEAKGTLMASPLLSPFEDAFSGLLCVSEFGFFAAYTDNYTDLDRRIYDTVINYLKKWQIDLSGLVRSRITHLVENENFDAAVSENTLYYSALRYARALAERLGETDTAFLDNSSNKLHSAIESKFFNGKVYSSGKVCDDRANAFIVLSGLALSSARDSIATFLAAAQNASIYTECYIIEALCRLGRQKLASIRFKNRYYTISTSDSPSMPENFWLEGARCSLHSAMPLHTLLCCFGGIYVSNGGKEVTVTPRLADLDYIKFTAITPSGKIRGDYRRNKDKVVHTIYNGTDSDVIAVLYNTSGDITRTIKLGKREQKIVLE